MSIWKKDKPDRPDNEENGWQDGLEQRLESLRFEPDPQFRQELKQRLMQQVAAQPAGSHGMAGRLKVWLAMGAGRRSPARLLVGTTGALAFLLVLISILSVGRMPDREAGPLAAVPPATEPARPPDPPAAIQVYDNARQSYLGLDEAARAAGFELRAPTYLPAGYNLEYAGLVETGERPLMPGLTGYVLRYTSPDKPVKGQSDSIEITQWKVPFQIVAGLENMKAVRPGELQPRITGAMNFASQVVKGKPAYLIQGGTWNMLLSDTAMPGLDINMEAVRDAFRSVAPAEKPSLPARPAIAPAPGGPAQANPLPHAVEIPVTAARAGTPAGKPSPPAAAAKFGTAGNNYIIEFGRSAGGPKSKALVWQRNEVLAVISASEQVSEVELKRMAESM